MTSCGSSSAENLMGESGARRAGRGESGEIDPERGAGRGERRGARHREVDQGWRERKGKQSMEGRRQLAIGWEVDI